MTSSTLPEKGLILAAGRGTRLKHLTNDNPKCLVKAGGQHLITWQLSAMRKAGLTDVVVMTGYKKEQLEELAPRTLNNPNWETTNMVSTLLCAEAEFDVSVVVSYSDILYAPDAVQDIMEAEGEIVLAYDINWARLWSRRFSSPLSDAESFRIKDGRVTEIGSKIDSMSEPQGQYMGLLKISPKGMQWIKQTLKDSPETFSSIDMTALLSRLIAEGHPIMGQPIACGWCEVDDQEDLKVAEELIKEGQLIVPENS